MAWLTFKKVRSIDETDGSGVFVHLFTNSSGRVCGWFIGPLVCGSTGAMDVPYLPRSLETAAPLAVVRAIEIARDLTVSLCVVDPHDLWEPAWQD